MSKDGQIKIIQSDSSNNKTKKRNREENLCEKKENKTQKHTNENEKEIEVDDDKDNDNSNLSLMDYIHWLLPMIHWGIRDWIVTPIKVFFFYGYAMKWITFFSWYLSEDRETLVDLRQYQIVETDEISIFDINNFRYPTVMWYGKRIISQSFWCFWDPGHIIYCVLMYFFIVLMTWFWKGLQILFIRRMVDYLKRKVLENKRRIGSVKNSNKRKILKVGSKRINKKQKHN